NPPPSRAPTVSEGACAAVQGGLREARLRGAERAGGEHLRLAMLAQPDAATAALLRDDVPTLLTAIVHALGEVLMRPAQCDPVHAREERCPKGGDAGASSNR